MPEHEKPQPSPENLQAPWRLKYLEAVAANEAAPKSGGTGCFLRDDWLAPEQDARRHVILRTADEPAGTGGMILLNAYPYTNGHLLVALGDGRPTLLDYEPEQREALWRLVDRAAALMQKAVNPHGINIGVNQGRAAGAGVPQHLHAHLVPRWGGDVNFMSTIAGVRVMPSSLDDMYARYLEVLD